ncbi:MAG: hypothetical protein GXY49_14275 [Syntrophomonadaceae bacterium]|jgi:hypothetical protein|nr:hypothetical protein [Syntrophomonadaceae bacterium]
MDYIDKLKISSVVGGFRDYDNWDDPGETFEIKFTATQWELVRYLSYMAYYDELNNGDMSDDEAIEKFIKHLIENELLDPKLQERSKLKQQTLFDDK